MQLGDVKETTTFMKNIGKLYETAEKLHFSALSTNIGGGVDRKCQ